MQLCRLGAIIAWTIAAFCVWPLFLLEALRILVALQTAHHWPPASRWLPLWFDVFFIYGIFGGGTMLSATVALVLGLKGKLWLTGIRRFGAGA
jgi:hypothetical protein